MDDMWESALPICSINLPRVRDLYLSYVPLKSVSEDSYHLVSKGVMSFGFEINDRGVYVLQLLEP